MTVTYRSLLLCQIGPPLTTFSPFQSLHSTHNCLSYQVSMLCTESIQWLTYDCHLQISTPLSDRTTTDHFFTLSVTAFHSQLSLISGEYVVHRIYPVANL